MIPSEKSRRVRGEKSDKADKPGNTDRCSYRECREKENIKSCRPDRNAEHSRFILPDGQCQYMAVEQEKDRDGLSVHSLAPRLYRQLAVVMRQDKIVTKGIAEMLRLLHAVR